MAEAVAHYVAGTLPSIPDWQLPQAVSAHSAINAAGHRVWFLHNFSFDKVEVTAPMTLENLQGSLVEIILLGSWDVAILRERAES